ncbi:sulfurtransferase [Janthinobacterium sp. 17J80-10]|uniref:sulfurtransferase n=1 Tax=Janthinobacterium sp. 17J80-10 TaxID=2497863 RepID=UPI00100583B5|nr:sulfurtransferase [Janthinobacterium sp. 17J80-10]QAU35730.1 sulfurtransferase [Janthinobacterium sp. 17J80-10]
MRHTTLISASELAHHALEPDWVVIDCRHDLALPDAGRLTYEAGHIPGAQFAHLDRDLSGGKTDAQGNFLGRHPLPERAAFIETLRRWGINNKSQVVAYDGQGGMFAARLWWLLRWVGHEAVAVLDGGVQAWTASGMWLSAELRGKPYGDFIAQAPLVATVDAAALVANLQAQARTVIDARAPDRFRGENETIDPVGGHIPGAKNRFFKDNLQADGSFKPAAQLRAEWQQLLPAPQTGVMQCGSGVTACHNLLALEVAGLPGAALYPGSWSEWCADPTRPVAQGPE